MRLIPDKWADLIFNLQERWHHSIVPGEIELLRNNRLFATLTDEEFHYYISKVRLVKYGEDDHILREGEPGNACYVVFDGEVGIFIRNYEGARIQMATLKKGDLFGEQVFLGESSLTRNADVDALSPVTLVYIPKEVLSEIFQKHPDLRLSLIKLGYEQACENLSTSTGFYYDVKDLIPNLQNIPIIEFKKDDLIFEMGDRPDYAYFILRGQVELVQQTFSEDSPVLIMHPGLIFGEAGVLGYTGYFKNQRAISALAHSDVRLLAVPGDDFKRALIGNMPLKLFLSKLQKNYRIPLKGIENQYFTSVPNLGPAITTIYQLEEGRSVISRVYLLHDLFTMYLDNYRDAKHYVYENEILKIEIDVLDKRLVGIKSTGMWDDLAYLCQILLNNEVVDKATFAKLDFIGRSIHS